MHLNEPKIRMGSTYGRVARPKPTSVLYLTILSPLTTCLICLHIMIIRFPNLRFRKGKAQSPKHGCTVFLNRSNAVNVFSVRYSLICYRGIIKFVFHVLYSTLLHLPPLRFHCVGGCWDRSQDCCDFGTGSQTL